MTTTETITHPTPHPAAETISIPCHTCGQRPSKVTGPQSYTRVCLPCYKKERRSLAPVPSSSAHMKKLPMLTKKHKCAVCGRPGTHWEFDSLEGNPVTLKKHVLWDTAPFLESFWQGDYAVVCDKKSCREEFLLEPLEEAGARIEYLELLVVRVWAGKLTPKELPDLRKI